MNELLEAKNKQKIKLENSVIKLQSFIPSESVKIKLSLNKTFETKINGTYLYVFKTKLIEKEKLIKAFLNQSNKSDFKLSSINNIEEFNGTIYVGSSNSLKSRINLHLGNSSKKVYSLHLSNWFTNFEKEIDLEYYFIPTEYLEITEILENGLWDIKKPLFGKKGTNIKSSINL